jgi:hypothetical protein
VTIILNELKDGSVVEFRQVELTENEAATVRMAKAWPEVVLVFGAFWSLDDWNGTTDATYMRTYGLTLERTE